VGVAVSVAVTVGVAEGVKVNVAVGEGDEVGETARFEHETRNIENVKITGVAFIRFSFVRYQFS